jgi:hypothetical protein
MDIEGCGPGCALLLLILLLLLFIVPILINVTGEIIANFDSILITILCLLAPLLSVWAAMFFNTTRNLRAMAAEGISGVVCVSWSGDKMDISFAERSNSDIVRRAALHNMLKVVAGIIIIVSVFIVIVGVSSSFISSIDDLRYSGFEEWISYVIIHRLKYIAPLLFAAIFFATLETIGAAYWWHRAPPPIFGASATGILDIGQIHARALRSSLTAELSLISNLLAEYQTKMAIFQVAINESFSIGSDGSLMSVGEATTSLRKWLNDCNEKYHILIKDADRGIDAWREAQDLYKRIEESLDKRPSAGLRDRLDEVFKWLQPGVCQELINASVKDFADAMEGNLAEAKGIQNQVEGVSGETLKIETREDALRILGLPLGASPKEIHDLYISQAKIFSPDRVVSNDELRKRNEEHMKRLNAARDFLKENPQ